jgi:hypothetical protein
MHVRNTCVSKIYFNNAMEMLIELTHTFLYWTFLNFISTSTLQLLFIDNLRLLVFSCLS